MKFGEFPLSDILGGYLAHSVKLKTGLLSKGRLITEQDVQSFRENDITHVMAAIFEPDDISENIAAAQVADHVAGAHIRIADAFTGRANLYAAADGIVFIDELAVSALNHVNEAITIATVSQNALVQEGQMIATVKIIPLAVAGAILEDIRTNITSHLIKVMPFHPLKATLIQTSLNGTGERKLDKAKTVTTHRLHTFKMSLNGDVNCPHNVLALSEELQKAATGTEDVILIMGASAITDRRDVIPAAIERAGGEIIHYGMPVDPGNLMLMAKLSAKWVLGLPGCSRSPNLNGIDLILARLAAGLNLSRDYVMGLGVGGLLNEYPGRPQPREKRKKMVTSPQKKSMPSIAALVLAAGQSKRMGENNKLLLPFHGKAVLSHIIEQAEKAELQTIHVITGHQKKEVEKESCRHDVTFIHNDLYEEGMSTSVKLGIQSLPKDIDAVLILLGDMPSITVEIIQKMIAAYNPIEGRSIIIPTHNGRRGNPILWDREFFEEFKKLDGDMGAKILLTEYQDYIHEVEMETDAIFFDIDTLEAYQRLSQE